MKSKLLFLCSAALSVFMTSCITYEINPESNKGCALTFTSAVDPEVNTKTEWNGKTIMWSKGDRIALSYLHNGVAARTWFESEALKTASHFAEFSVQTDINASAAGILDFHAIYPSECITDNFKSFEDAEIRIPIMQTPSASTYDRTADLMIAHSIKSYESVPAESIPLVWQRLVAHLDLSLISLNLQEGETLSRLTLIADNNAKLTGLFSLNAFTGNLSGVETSNEVRLNLMNTTSNIDEDIHIWAVTMPTRISDLKVEVLTSEAVYTREIQACNLDITKNARNIVRIDMSAANRSPRTDASSLVRSEHPRLFITSEDIPVMKACAQGSAAKIYNATKTRVDELMSSEITFPDPLAKTGESNKNHEVGFRAADAATVWLVTGDRAYLEHTKTILEKLIDYYELRVENNLNIAWYVYSQISALCAYDWIYNDLTAEERARIGNALYSVMHEIAWHGNGIRPARYRENKSEPTTGCYGVSVLPWYLALTFYGDGVNDQRCAEMFAQGYDFHKSMIAYRRAMAGEKGGGATACVGYSFGYYPLADFNFIRTYKAATGIDLSDEMDYVLKYLDYLDWVRLPGNKDFGFGDASHSNCLLPHVDINYHISEIADIYGDRYSHVLPLASRMLKQFPVKRSPDKFPFIRLLHDKEIAIGGGAGIVDDVRSMYYETMGQVYMRSGIDDDDTYAMFVSGGVTTNHKHYDNNNFVIYKYGYRALDTGSRPEPGQHLSHYYSRTVAHNCVTIRMPGEVMPNYWGEPAPDEEVLPVPNDGGQNNLLASEIKHMVETEDYVYLASDATGSYNSLKAALVVREFIYFLPDVFVIFDRLVSKDASYPKTWLYHTADEPIINGMEFSETSQGGMSVCRTLYPSDAVIEKIGGPGKQFWSDGRNWPFPADKASTIPDDTWPMVGQWRIEIKPGAEREKDYFMNIIKVGAEGTVLLPQTNVFEDETHIGVEFTYEGKNFSLSFDTTKDYGCNIEVN